MIYINIVRDYYPYRRESRFSVPIDQHNVRLYCTAAAYTRLNVMQYIM